MTLKCDVCGRRRLQRNLVKLAVPVTFVVNYATGEAQEYPAGTLICRSEWRKLSTVGGGSRSEGQSIAYRDGKWRRDDGTPVLNTME